MAQKRQTQWGITGFALKMIAIITMLLDHIGAVILERQTGVAAETAVIFRIIGRLAFPLFCFFIVEGFHYTHDRRKYAARLALFAVIAEIPFDLAFSHKWFAPSDNSVMLTLFLGLLSIWALDAVFQVINRSFSDHERTGILLRTLWTVCVIAAVWGLETCLNSDYGMEGVAAILIIYLLRRYKLTGFAASVVWLGITCGDAELFALIDLIPLAFYRGKQGRKMKYFFYAFYPVHLLILVGIAYKMGLW